MTLRLGFCGVGKWARKLAESFRACGAEVVAYDRRSFGGPPPEHANHGPGVYWSTCNRCEFDKMGGWGYPPNVIPPGGPEPVGFGKRTPWRDQLADKNIDALVAVAPPAITAEVVLGCARVGKAVLGTKPLMRHPGATRGPVWVDLWRLWTFGHRAVKEKWEADPSPGLLVNLYGDGPFRDFPGGLDYGPHVMATLLDIQPGLTIKSATKLNGGPSGELFRVHFGPGDIVANFGNAGEGRSDRRLAYGAKDYDDWVESGDNSWGTRKDAAIQAMCRAFMADVDQGIGDPRTLNLSRDGMALLEKIREVAK